MAFAEVLKIPTCVLVEAEINTSANKYKQAFRWLVSFPSTQLSRTLLYQRLSHSFSFAFSCLHIWRTRTSKLCCASFLPQKSLYELECSQKSGALLACNAKPRILVVFCDVIHNVGANKVGKQNGRGVVWIADVEPQKLNHY